MKQIFNLALAVVAAFGVSSCVETAPEYEFAEEEPSTGVYFLNTDNAAKINPTDEVVDGDATSFNYWLGRSYTSGSLTVNIESNCDPRITVPSSVTFADGQATAPLTVTFQQLSEDPSPVNLKIADSNKSIYGGVQSFQGVLKQVPFWRVVTGHYVNPSVIAYWGDEYSFDFVIESDPEDPENKVLLKDFDPFFFGNGYTADKGYNTLNGIIDLDNKQILIPAGQFPGPAGYGLYSFNDPDADVADDDEEFIVLKHDGNLSCTLVNSMYIYNSGYYEIFPGAITFTKK